MIHFTCPKCGGRVRVPEKFAGKRGRCPNCKVVVEIPTAGDVGEQGAWVDAAADTIAGQAAPPPKQLGSAPGALNELAEALRGPRPPQPPVQQLQQADLETPQQQALAEPPAAPPEQPAEEEAAPAVAVEEALIPPLPVARPLATVRAERACLALYVLFSVCLAFWLLVVSLPAVGAVILGGPSEALGYVIAGAGIVLAILVVAGSAFALAYLPARWAVISQLPAKDRFRACVGGLGLVVLLVLWLTVYGIAVFAAGSLGLAGRALLQSTGG